MKLVLDRIYKCPKYTIGKLYINDVYFCDTIEDVDRGLSNNQTVAEISKKKVFAETAIPTGTYTIEMNVVSPKFKNAVWAKQCDGKVPRLLSVPGFDGILIHPSGTTQADTAGCIIVGKNKVVGKVIESQITFKALYTELKQATDNKEEITITIE